VRDMEWIVGLVDAQEGPPNHVASDFQYVAHAMAWKRVTSAKRVARSSLHGSAFSAM
jgi:hypothetical protein